MLREFAFRKSVILIILLAIALTGSTAIHSQTTRRTLPAVDKVVLDQISAESLRGHLSFIASDLLEGRDTPSRGLDIAAEYIAAQFRRAGLAAVGDDGYFQTAHWIRMTPQADGFELTFSQAGQTISLASQQISLASDQGLQLPAQMLFKLDYNDATTLAALTEEQMRGRVIFTEIPDFRRQDRSRWSELFRAQQNFLRQMQTLKVALVVSIDRYAATGSGASTGRLLDPENRRNQGQVAPVPVMRIHASQVIRMFDALPVGQTDARITVNAPPAIETPVRLRNVIGLLRGSDPKLRDTYILVTAHYDHVGIRPDAEGDQIWNGANDDGSGTVSVIELAAALAKRRIRPKRSIVFMTVFGEEKGLLGSRYYGRHPIFPIEKTVADINLEQVGRTDSTEGPQINNASLTGFDFSDLGDIFKLAGQRTGVTVYKHERNSDAFFGRSDNQALADLGVPATTLCVAFEYPDYHGAADHWDKVDYDNMARVNRMIALTLLTIANNRIAPKWNEANPKAERYVKAWKDRMAN